MKTKTKAEREHLARVASLPCCVCGFEEVQVHHIRTGYGMGQRASHFETIALCFKHHLGAEGIHTIGTRTWQAKYGSETDFLDKTNAELFVPSGYGSKRKTRMWLPTGTQDDIQEFFNPEAI